MLRGGRKEPLTGRTHRGRGRFGIGEEGFEEDTFEGAVEGVPELFELVVGTGKGETAVQVGGGDVLGRRT